MPQRFRTATIKTVTNSYGMCTLWLRRRGACFGLMAEQRYMADALVACLGLDGPWEGKRIRFKAEGQMLTYLAPAKG